jgi:uncharacterized membrane protein YsdA (DUF1294 family)
MMSSLALAYYLTINLATFIVYWWDKSAARQGRWRTRETVLLTFSILGGAFGGLLAMTLLHHKTRKPVFWVVNLAGCAIHLFLIIFVFSG